MKNILAAAFLICATFSLSAQKFITVIADSDTSVSLLESKIFKIDNLTDSTSTIYYIDRQDYIVKLNTDTNEAKYVALGSRLLTPSGLGYTINVDNILEAKRLTDNTCLIWYKDGVLTKKITLSISVGDLNALINAL